MQKSDKMYRILNVNTQVCEHKQTLVFLVFLLHMMYN